MAFRLIGSQFQLLLLHQKQYRDTEDTGHCHVKLYSISLFSVIQTVQVPPPVLLLHQPQYRDTEDTGHWQHVVQPHCTNSWHLRAVYSLLGIVDRVQYTLYCLQCTLHSIV